MPAEPEIPWRVSHPSIIQLLTSVFELGTGVSNMVTLLTILVCFGLSCPFAMDDMQDLKPWPNF